MPTEPSARDETSSLGDHPRLQRSSLTQGSILADRYRVERLIGAGGMGDVYLATHLVIDKRVAVKVLAPEQMRRDRTVTRFLQEAKAASKIRHPNVVDITDYGESDGCAFFVMEYLEGEDLDCLLKREGRISWERARMILVQLLEALGAAHRAGVVHRDIKPHNCFITPGAHGVEVAKVIDFGIAKLRVEGSEEQLTRTGAIMGTAEYMSPEQGLGEDIDGRSDLYSVGVILYRMLTGSVPYTGSNPMGILYQHIHGEIPSPREAVPEAGISPGVDALVKRALAKDRDMRFASAEAFIEALHAADGVPTVTAPGRWRRWALAGAGLVLLAGGLVWVGAREHAAVPVVALAEPSDAAELAGSVMVPEADAAADFDEPMVPAIESDGDVSAKVPEAEDEDGDEDEDEDEDEPTDGKDAAVDDGSSSDPSRTAPPVRRSPRALRAPLSKIAGKVGSCGKKAGLFPGEKVRVEIRIGTDGKVEAAEVMGSFSKAGATCIETVVRSVRFGPASRPQSHVHTFHL